MRFFSKLLFLGFFGILTSACTETQLAAHIAKQIPMPGDTPDTVGHFKVGAPYTIKGKRYYPKETYRHSETGMASWYGPGFHGKLTANGEIYDQYALTAAHRTLQLPSMVEVTNLANGRSLILRVNDRGPFAHNRVIDVSKKAAELLDFKHAGVAKVRVRVLPEESRRLAMMAKAGRSTAGTEVAMNRSGTLDEFRLAKLGSATPVRKPWAMEPSAGEESIVIAREEPLPDPQISAPVLEARPAPKPVIQTVQMAPIVEEEVFFIHADTMEDMDDAETLRLSLLKYGHARLVPAIEDGQTVYQVKVGPVSSRQRAENLLAQIRANGRDNSTLTIAKR